MSVRIFTVIGARPQFIKASAVSRAIREINLACPSSEITEIIVHTGQHYDHNMSGVFFEQMDIPKPDYNLDIHNLSHGAMTGRMLERLERLIIDVAPDVVLVYGDTNSTLAGALAAAKLFVPVAHVEAGLRSYNKKMPEEINRVLADKISDFLFCPTLASVQNLEKEGITKNVYNVGDVMYDISVYYSGIADEKSEILRSLCLHEKKYALATVHRAENTDDPSRLEAILLALSEIAKSLTLVFPVHPRTRKAIEKYGLEKALGQVMAIKPIPFLDMIRLERSATTILTDSGGIQKEAFFYSVPCITLRDETEWRETVEAEWNHICGADTKRIVQTWKALAEYSPPPTHENVYGSGDAGKKIINTLFELLRK